MSLVELGAPQTAAEMRNIYKAAHHRLYHTRPRPKVIAIHDHTPSIQPLTITVVPAGDVPVESVTRIEAAVEAMPPRPRPITIARILNVVSAVYGVPVLDITSHRRTKNVIVPRQVAMHLARTMTPHSFPTIAKQFGGRDHTTVLYTCQKIAGLLESDAALAARIAELHHIVEVGA